MLFLRYKIRFYENVSSANSHICGFKIFLQTKKIISNYEKIDINILPIDFFLQDATDLKLIIDRIQIINRACCHKKKNIRKAAKTLIRKENRIFSLLFQNRNTKKKNSNLDSTFISCSSSTLSSFSQISNSMNGDKKSSHKNSDDNKNMFFSYENQANYSNPPCRSSFILLTLLSIYRLYCLFSIQDIFNSTLSIVFFSYFSHSL